MYTNTHTFKPQIIPRKRHFLTYDKFKETLSVLLFFSCSSIKMSVEIFLAWNLDKRAQLESCDSETSMKGKGLLGVPNGARYQEHWRFKKRQSQPLDTPTCPTFRQSSRTQLDRGSIGVSQGLAREKLQKLHGDPVAWGGSPHIIPPRPSPRPNILAWKMIKRKFLKSWPPAASFPCTHGV
jgi:hypothetical protein